MTQKPSFAFIASSWVTFGTGIIGYFTYLFNEEMQLAEKGYYFTIIMFGLFSAISVQKCVRDRLENIQVTDLYYGISWFCTILSITLLVIGLWNANLFGSEKGVYAFSFILSLFGVIAIQKNTRDTLAYERQNNI
jgi:uncharacterized membrane protein YiaA